MTGPWLTPAEVERLRTTLGELRGHEAPPPRLRGSSWSDWMDAAAALANVVEELLVELHRRRPLPAPEVEDVALYLGGCRTPLVCQGCGRQYEFTPKLTTITTCYFCTPGRPA